MRKFLSSIVLIITAMLFFCGCEDKNYNDQQYTVTPMSTKPGVISMKDVNSSGTTSGVFTVKEAEVIGNSVLLVTYQFKNSASYSRSFGELLGWGAVHAYQDDVILEGTPEGNMTINTEVQSGAAIDIKTRYKLINGTDPITVIAQDDWLLFSDATYVNKEITLGTVMNENFASNSVYGNEITKATLADNGTMTIFNSFANNGSTAVTPASAVAVQAFQGTERLSIVGEGMTDETHYQKYYYVEPGQRTDLSTTFRLNNNNEDVTVYLTVPSSAEIYAKQVYKVK
ncbi:DUF5067 domain-containing protein [Huintestinicola sp.]|uniref:DUF5067 domain-containing protein n=1 Tax=Huintestinicola sp. TaxID=2981661 RepID=UPI003D7C3E9B